MSFRMWKLTLEMAGGKARGLNPQQKRLENIGIEAKDKAEVGRELGRDHQSWESWEVPMSRAGAEPA